MHTSTDTRSTTRVRSRYLLVCCAASFAATLAWSHKPLRAETGMSGELLGLVDTDTDVVGGDYKRDGDSWIISDSAKLIIAKSPQGDYTLRVRAMRKSGGYDIKVYFPVGDAIVQFVLSGWNKTSGLQMIDKKPWDQNSTSVKKGGITNGKWYDIAITVIDHGDDADIVVKLDGAKYTHWSGAKASLSSTSGVPQRVTEDRLIMVGCAHDAVDEYASIRLDKPDADSETAAAPDHSPATEDTAHPQPATKAANPAPTTQPLNQQHKNIFEDSGT